MGIAHHSWLQLSPMVGDAHPTNLVLIDVANPFVLSIWILPMLVVAISILQQLLKNRPHERTLIADETFCFFVVLHRGLAFRIISRLAAIGLIGRQ